METFLFKHQDLALAVRWEDGKAYEILLNPTNLSDAACSTPREVERFFRDVERYLEGGKVRFSLPIDISRLAPFARRASEELMRTNPGETLTYGELARRAAKPGAARAVGRLMAKNPFPLVVPCHRVVGADGALRGFSAGLELKKRLLDLEDSSES